MEWQALNDHVIVKADNPLEEMGGITIPAPARDALMAKSGVILSVGPIANKDNGGLLEVGRRVRYNKYSGLEMDPTDDTILAIRANELLGIKVDRLYMEPVPPAQKTA